MRRLWALENSDGDICDFDGIGRTEFSDGPFEGYLEYREVSDGIGFYRLEAQSDQDFTLSAAEHCPSDMLIIGCILAGEGRIELAGSAEQPWQDSGRLYALTPFGRRTNYHVRAGSRWRSTAIKIDARIVDRVADDPVPPLVLEAVRNGGAPISESMPLAPALARVAEDLARPVYQGQMATLYRESKVLELLSLQFDALAAEPPRQAGLSAKETARVRDARDRLLSDLKHTPQLHELAHCVGLTPKRLNQGFRQLYGTTVFEMLRDTRLDAARDMLGELPEMPLKQIAWTVGYAQATNFISAYRRRFGVPPGQHKRLTRGD